MVINWKKGPPAVDQILIHLWQKINPALGAPGKLLSVTDWAPERFLSRGGSNEDLKKKSMKNREFFDCWLPTATAHGI